MTVVLSTTAVSGTLAQLRNALQQRGYGTDTIAAQNELLNSVYRRVCGLRRWPFLVKTDSSIVTTIGQDTYDLVAAIPDLLHVDAVRIAQGTDYRNLQYVRQQELRSEEHLYRDNGQPSNWTRRSNNLIIWPRPDAAYTLSVDYVIDPPDLTSDAVSVVIPTAYEDVLIWGAIGELAFRERDWYGHEFASQEYTARLQEMMNEFGVTNRQTSAEVVRSGALESVNDGYWNEGVGWMVPR